MKSLILILFLIPALCNGQTCPPGHSFMPSIRSGSTYIMADKCLPDSIVREMWAEYYRNLSPRDTMTTNYYGTYRILSIGFGQYSIQVYQKLSSGGWKEVTSCLWYWENKTRLRCYGGWEQRVEISCCSHYHKTKPL